MTNQTITNLLDDRRCIVSHDIFSKKSVIEKSSTLIASDLVNVVDNDLFFELIEREKLGSTAIGHGVAIPHARSGKVSTPIGAFIKLATPIDFEANDDTKVDLVFSLIVPTEEDKAHLQLLAALANIFNQSSHRDRLRQCENDETLYSTMLELSRQTR